MMPALYEFMPHILSFLGTVIIAVVTAMIKHAGSINRCIHRIEIMMENLSTRVTIIENSKAPKRIKVEK